MNNTLSNGFRLLEYLASSGRSHSVKELAEEFNLPNSHICRLLKTLTETGYVKQDSSRRYLVSVKILALSNACLSRLKVRTTARRFMYELFREVGFRVYLTVPEQGQALIVDVISDGTGDEMSLNIGKFNSVHLSACGKLCAAYASNDELKTLLALPLTGGTAKACNSIKRFEAELAKIRQQRYAVTDGEASDGTYAVAAPVFNGEGELIATVGSYFENPQATLETKSRLLQSAIRCANAISCELLAEQNR